MASKILTVPEAAKVARVSDWLMYELIKGGEGPPVVRLGRRVVIREVALHESLEQRESTEAATGAE